MNRVERISAILIQLQSKKIVRGQDLADRFSISLRTAYRDIRALEEAGVPIIGEAGTGYSLVDGYKLPPVMFTKEEAIAFLTAEKLVEKFTDPSTSKIYQSALFKIKAVLKHDDKEHINSMDKYIEVLANQYLPSSKEKSDYIQIILKSITSKKIIAIDYFANHNQQNSKRNVEAVGIFLMGKEWYLIAYCWLRNDYRNFRVDRIRKIELSEFPFKKQHPDLKTYLKEITKEKRELQTILIQVETAKLKYFGEQKFYNGFVSEKVVKDKTEMTFLTSSVEGFARWYMMYGDCAKIISPASLKKRVKEISTVLSENLK